MHVACLVLKHLDWCTVACGWILLTSTQVERRLPVCPQAYHYPNFCHRPYFCVTGITTTVVFCVILFHQHHICEILHFCKCCCSCSFSFHHSLFFLLVSIVVIYYWGCDKHSWRYLLVDVNTHLFWLYPY